MLLPPQRSKTMVRPLFCAILACGMLVSFAPASPGPEPLQDDLPAIQSAPDATSPSVPFVLLIVLLIGGLGIGIHARRRDKDRLKDMKDIRGRPHKGEKGEQPHPDSTSGPTCGKNVQALEGVPQIG
jgi:hypothetical protein